MFMEVPDGWVVLAAQGAVDCRDVGIGDRRVVPDRVECGKGGPVGGFGLELGGGQHARRARRVVW